jgi:SNF2 family DNA or RNA helicase
MFTSVLDLIADACKVRLPDFGFVQVDGDTRGVERHDLLTEFRTRPSVRGLFLTYKVGAEGLNLIEATHVVRVEPWWTNAVHEQADSRCHRMGQTREVQIHNVLVENSIEESIMKVCRDKDEISDKLLTGSGQKITAGLDKYTLGQILGVYQ